MKNKANLEEVAEALELKADSDNVYNSLNKIKTQIQSINVLIGNIENKKADNKNIEKLNSLLIKKIDEDKFNYSLKQLKDNIFDTINSFKNDYLTNIKIFEIIMKFFNKIIIQ